MLTDAELAEVEGFAQAYLIDWPDHPRVRFMRHVHSMATELRRLRGMKCETCAEWKMPADDCVSAPDGWGQCLLCEVGTKTYSEDLAYPVGVEYNESLLTAPDFGCVRWQPKEAKP